MTASELTAWLADLVHRTGMPGAAVAVLHRHEVLGAESGVLDVRTQEPVTAETVFQVGSTTKVMTAAILLQLVDEGLLTLDTPVRDVLPEFTVGGADLGGVTVRRLLDHTSGLPGHHFADFGPGTDSIARYVDSMADLDLIHRPGVMYSYCNGGYVVAGRLAEVVSGAAYADLVAERISGRLALGSITTRADGALARPVATGHERAPDGHHVVSPLQVAAWSSTPAGSQTTSTATDLARFARAASVAGGAVSEASTAGMTRPSVELPCPYWGRSAQCLGWGYDRRAGTVVLLHGGGTTGHSALMVAVPERDVAFAVVTNSADGGDLLGEAETWLLRRFAGVGPRRSSPEPRHDLTVDEAGAVVGTYTDIWTTTHVERDGNAVRATTEIHASSLNDAVCLPPVGLAALDPTTFVAGSERPIVFLRADRDDLSQPITHLHRNNASRRVDDVVDLPA